MIRFDDTAKRVSKKLKMSKDFVKKVLNKTFEEIENNLEHDKSFMFKGYAKFVKSKQKKKPITKTELFNLKTKDK
jgi:nucleoid DNA-binding protein